MEVDFNQFQIGHIGVLVEDLDQAVRHAYEDLHIGPWRMDTLAEDVPTWNRGKPVKSAQRMAFAKVAGLEVEMIQPLEGSDTYMLEALRAGGPGVSHCGMICDSLEQMEELAQALRALGYEEVHHAKAVGPAGDGGNYHFDTRKALGFYLEIAEPITITQEMIDREVWYPKRPD